MNQLWAFIRKDTRARRIALVVVVLVIGNLWFFGDHYREKVSFSYDFKVTYHSVPFYWQGVVKGAIILAAVLIQRGRAD